MLGESVVLGRFHSWLALVLTLAGLLSQARADAHGGAPLVRQPNTTLRLPAQTPIEGFGLVNAFGDVRFEKPVAVVCAPGETNRVFVVEKTGRIWAASNTPTPGRELFLDLSDRTVHSTEAGLLGLAFHPNFVTNGHFFVFRTTLTNLDGGLTSFYDVLSRFTISATNPAVASPESELVLFAQADDLDTHNGGDLHFGPDGYLYLGVGDETPPPADASPNKQAIDKGFFGGILRLDVDRRPGNLPPNPRSGVTEYYSIPADNPFIGLTNYQGLPLDPSKIRTEFFAIGLRNPWRMAFHPVTGELWVGEVGGGFVEEINRVTSGANYGWPYLENAYPGPHEGGQPPEFASTPPVYAYEHGNGTNQGRCVIGGVFYQGGTLPGLAGDYVFGDYYSGHVWAMRIEGTNVSGFRRLASAPGLSAFGLDPSNGDVLAANHSDGVIYRLVHVAPGVMPPLPPTLDAAGVFTNLLTLTPHAGVVPYEINTPFWSDNADKRRWFSLPDPAQQIGFDPTAAWTFPTGAVWVKHFELELTNGAPASRRRLETRLLVRGGDSVYGLTYRWDESQTNATLVPEIGLDEDIPVFDGGVWRTQRWRYPGRWECLVCHNAGAGRVLGFGTAQLNRDVDHGAGPVNQLRALAAAGYFSNEPPDPAGLLALAHATNTAAPLAHRARSFLAANCSSCHHPGSTAEVPWDARITTPLAAAAILDAPVVYGAGWRFLDTQTPTNSMALHRLAALDLNRMPTLGSSVVNTNAIDLLARWITSLPPAPWVARNFGTTSHEGASSFAEGRWEIGGAGAGFTAIGDVFHQAGRRMADGARLTARLVRRPGANPAAFAGLIARAGLGALEPFAAIGVNGTGALVTWSRADTNAPPQAIEHDPAGAVVWLSLAREGNATHLWHSTDGVTWNQAATELSDAAGPWEIGFASAGGDAGTWHLAEFDSTTLTGVRLTAPTPGVISPAFAPITLFAETLAEGVAINRVEFWAGDELVAQITNAPFTTVWNDAPAGVHSLRAVLVDASGGTVASTPVDMQVASAGNIVMPGGTDSETQGGWAGTFGTAGYVIAAVATNLPATVGFSITNAARVVWAFITTDERALLRPSGIGRVASAWRGTNGFSLELDITDGVPRALSLYFLDWDTGGARQQDVQLRDFDTGEILSTTRLGNFAQGTYLRYSIHGHVSIHFIPVAGGDAVLSGLFLDPDFNQPPQAQILQPASGVYGAPASFNVAVAASDEHGLRRVELLLDGVVVAARTNSPWSFTLPALPVGTHTLQARAWDVWNQPGDSSPITLEITAPPARAVFAGEDTTTQGDWPGNYGARGYLIVEHFTNLPPFVEFTRETGQPFLWADGVTNREALRHPQEEWRVAPSLFDDQCLVLDLDLRDGWTHRVGLYFMEWGPSVREQRVEVRDAATGLMLDQRIASAFATGKYLLWDVRGHVRFHIQRQASGNAVMSALFLDASLPPLESWRQARFTPEQLASLSVSAASADPDGDGLVNAVEFAMGLDPLVTDARPRMELDDDQLTLTYRRSKDVSPAAFFTDYSTNLVDWLSGPEHVLETERVDFGEIECVTVRAVVPVADQPGGYLRLRVQP